MWARSGRGRGSSSKLRSGRRAKTTETTKTAAAENALNDEAKRDEATAAVATKLPGGERRCCECISKRNSGGGAMTT